MPDRFALAMLSAALVIVLLGAISDVDMQLARAMFDPASGTFPWRHTWFAERLGHELVRRCLIATAVGVILAALWDALSLSQASLRRSRLRVVAWSAVLVPASVSALKQMSNSHCPWDLTDFGGTEVYVRLIEPVVSGAAAGHCYPAGHASGALWMISFSVVWLPQRPRTAAVVGAIMLSFGLALGWIQQLRGAHFLTHTLWSAWIACAIVGILYRRGHRALA